MRTARANETIAWQREHVQRLEEIVERHASVGSFTLAGVFAELLEEARARLQQTLADYRGGVTDLVSDKTHVIVGDHTPEPRVRHKPYEVSDRVALPYKARFYGVGRL